MNRPPPGGWTEADKVPRKGPTPQVPAMAGMSILGMLPAPEKNPEKTIWNSGGLSGPVLICAPHSQPCKHCKEPVNLADEGNTYEDGSCAHEHCHDSAEIMKANAADLPQGELF